MSDSVLDDASIALVNAAKLPISLAAIEEIIFEEDSSEAIYNKLYERPEWPGGMSGITIGLGYDLGQSSYNKTLNDFQGKVPVEMLNIMLKCVGLTGGHAHDMLPTVRNYILIPWNVALDVFLHRDMPLWIDTVRRTLPNTDKLHPDCLGALVSLAYNRGASFRTQGDRYREMRAIWADMMGMNLRDIPNQMRRMARLWPAGSGVHNRRFREATLFERGLAQMKGAIV